MKINLEEDSELKAELLKAVSAAPLQPEFVRALAQNREFVAAVWRVMRPEIEWMTYAEAMSYLRLKRAAFFDWKKENEGRLTISYALGKINPRISFSSIEAVMKSEAVGHEPEPPAKADSKPKLRDVAAVSKA